MGTHPIFESDFDCLTAMVQRLTYRRTLHTIPLPTRGRSSKPQVEDLCTNELGNRRKPQFAVTLVKFSVVSRPVDHVNWLNTLNVRRPSLELMAVLYAVEQFAPVLSELS